MLYADILALLALWELESVTVKQLLTWFREQNLRLVLCLQSATKLNAPQGIRPLVRLTNAGFAVCSNPAEKARRLNPRRWKITHAGHRVIIAWLDAHPNEAASIHALRQVRAPATLCATEGILESAEG